MLAGDTDITEPCGEAVIGTVLAADNADVEGPSRLSTHVADR